MEDETHIPLGSDEDLDAVEMSMAGSKMPGKRQVMTKTNWLDIYIENLQRF